LACAGIFVRSRPRGHGYEGGEREEKAVVPLQRRPSTQLQFPFPPVRIAAINHLLHCPAVIMYSARASGFGLRGSGVCLRTHVGGGRLLGCYRGRLGVFLCRVQARDVRGKGRYFVGGEGETRVLGLPTWLGSCYFLLVVSGI